MSHCRISLQQMVILNSYYREAKWQCFDAYSRVSMALGVHQIIQSINYFVLGITLVENYTPTTAVAVSLILQSVALAVLFLDVAGLETWKMIVMQLVGSAQGPCHHKRRISGC